MPTLTIPPRHRAGLKAIQDLSSESVKQLAAALAAAPVSVNQAVIRESLQGSVPALTENLKSILEALMAMYVVRSAAELPVEMFVNDVARAMADDDLDTASNPEILKANLAALLRVEAFSIASKAIGLKTEFPNTFCDARVMTDLRPVFGIEDVSAPLTGIITQTLKIEYHHGSNHQEFYVGLDADDIDDLIETLGRAQQKAKALRSLMKEMNFLT